MPDANNKTDDLFFAITFNVVGQLGLVANVIAIVAGQCVGFFGLLMSVAVLGYSLYLCREVFRD